jgi:hypothetical protein
MLTEQQKQNWAALLALLRSIPAAAYDHDSFLELHVDVPHEVNRQVVRRRAAMEAREHPESYCGTCACAMGWARLGRVGGLDFDHLIDLTGFSLDGNYVSIYEAANRVFGNGAYHAVFHESDQETGKWRGWDRVDVIAAAENFIKENS